METAAIRRPLILKNAIQEYQWGSHTDIQQLMGLPATPKPWAELWMGAHPKAASQVQINGKWMGLDALIQQFPTQILGPSTAGGFDGALPFLFKILAAEQPLSIQAHPDKDRAARGFERENAAGIPIDDPARNYRDASHKPECICALSPFTALKGFRDIEEIVLGLKKLCPDQMAGLMGTAGLTGDPRGNADPQGPHFGSRAKAPPPVGRLYAVLLGLPPDVKKRVIAETVGNARRFADNDPMCHWIRRLYQSYPDDIGILAPALMNLVTLAPGQALFLESGELHAYLKGMGIEIMANSDNVLRAGLTPKHVDTHELLAVARFDSTSAEILTPEPVFPHESRYPVRAEEFALSIIAITPEDLYTAPSNRSVEILLCTAGRSRLRHPRLTEEMILNPGDSVFVPAQADAYHLTGNAMIYKAGVPLP